MVNDTILGKIRLMNPGVGIEFENKVDFEPLVEDFTYISKNIVSPGVHIINASSIRCCSCKDKCKNELKCCSTRKTGRLAYNSRKCLTNFGNTNLPIYECNKNCKCGPDCINRVVQLGSNITLCLFKTSTGKDLGLKTRDLIHKGQFISEYVGEIIDYDTAEKRGRRYMRNGTHYVFNMDFYPSAEPYSIDATKFGNATRFINHSCNPNCAVYSVWYDCVDKNFPKLAFFALRQVYLN